MFLVDIHPEHGVVAAPADLDSIDGPTVDLLHGRGFRWNDDEEMFAAPVADANGEAAADLAVCVAAALLISGHNVAIICG
ncbi:hypothetical protein ABZ027_31725 [Streptomyces sp. NPDC006332]|uniref:hypothetical protein n=1 Tax=Streptomyces sp. NPDC006332 TaxID=3155456 RepID=UPI00339E09C6